MRMNFMQEARREPVSKKYVLKMQDSIMCSFVFLEPWCILYYLAVEVHKRANNMPMMLEQNLENRTEPTNETGHGKISDSQSVWSRDKQQAKQV